MTDWYWKNNFLFSLLAIEACLCRKLPRRQGALVRWVLFALLLLPLSSCLMENWEWAGNTIAADNIVSNVLWRGLLALFSAAQIYFCWQLSPSNALYLVVISITCQKIQFDLYMVLEMLLARMLHTGPFPEPSILLCLGTLALGCAAVFFVFSDRELLLFRHGSQNIATVLSALVLVVVMDSYNTYLFVHDPNSHIGSTMMVIRGSSILLHSLLIAVLYNLTVRRTLEMERLATHTIAKQRTLQYESSRELMQMVNIKSHDLKKQLRYLKQDPAGKQQLIEELEHLTAGFDAIIDTNNEALSTVLSEKSAACQHENIPFTVFGGSESISFMRDLDIYTLFANLLDNAIEASRKLEPGARSITLVIKSEKGFLSIHQENYFNGQIQQAGEELLTTKQDVWAHGFGYQSMRQIVERYNGILNHRTTQGVFAVNILIPIPDGTEQV